MLLSCTWLAVICDQRFLGFFKVWSSSHVYKPAVNVQINVVEVELSSNVEGKKMGCMVEIFMVGVNYRTFLSLFDVSKSNISSSAPLRAL